MRNFSDIRAGQEFHFNIDADGHEPYFYKINSKEAYQTHGQGQGLRHKISRDTKCWTTGRTVKITTQVTEVERAAITLLYQSHPKHFGLAAWVKALGTDKNEMRNFDDFVLEGATDAIDGTERLLADEMRKYGFVTPGKEYDFENSAWHAIFDRSPFVDQERNKDADEKYFFGFDKYILLLADAVRDYRIAGRPVGDQVHTIVGMGAPLMNVQTSLAAAIAEYHQSVIGELHYQNRNK